MRIARAAGITLLFFTHDTNEAVFMSDRVVVTTPRPGKVPGVVRHRPPAMARDRADAAGSFRAGSAAA